MVISRSFRCDIHTFGARRLETSDRDSEVEDTSKSSVWSPVCKITKRDQCDGLLWQLRGEGYISHRRSSAL